jgi:ethanolaminephosphotransferase
MDNMDGKQARKTGQSTCLGMLFDHGFDAVNAVLQAMTISRCLVFNSTQTTIAVVVAAIGFFATTFETYATKVFYLPKINAVNEGMLSIQATILFTAYIGPEFWLGESFGYNRQNLLILGLFVFALITLFGK